MEQFETKIKAIARSIRHHRQLEEKEYIPIKAVAHVKGRYDDEEKTFWITTKENMPARTGKDFNSNTYIDSRPGPIALSTDGTPVYRNSIVGEHLLKALDGKSKKIIVPKGSADLFIEHRTTYTPTPDSGLAENLRFEFHQSQPKYFNNLLAILRDASDLDRDIQTLNEAKALAKDDKDIEAYLQKINEKESQKKELFAKAQHFIRKNAELRYQPILDPQQESIKRSHLYDNTIVAINGGPGTGKTTSLIQRIRFLTDDHAMNEYLIENLRPKYKVKVSDVAKSWIFFSPNELLRDYLKNSVSAEGLAADDNSIKVWEAHKNSLVKKYRLFNAETQNPFLLLRNRSTEPLLPSEGRKLKTIIDRFRKTFFSEIRTNLMQLATFDSSRFSWHPLAKSIKVEIENISTYTSLANLIKLFFGLENKYKEEVERLLEPIKSELDRESAYLLKELEKQPLLKMRAEELVKQWAIDNVDGEENAEIEDELTEEVEEVDSEVLLFRSLRSILRKSALKLHDRSVRFTKRDQELLETVESVFNPNEVNHLSKIGELLTFSKYYGKYVRGVAPNIFSLIPQSYKRFRKNELETGNRLWNLDLLKVIVIDEGSRNKRLHSEEQAFLISFINEVLKSSYKVSIRRTKELNHSYIEAYHDESRAVIGIDEVTDFHPIDILCMESLCDWEFGSVTLSGDLLQRMTKNGLKKWEDLSLFFREFEVLDLLVSYRQSPTLLKIAEKIYFRATGNEATYESYTTKDPREPKPLFYLYDEDIEVATSWMAKRILEIFKAYGNSIPSIAIFVNRETAIDSMVKYLSDIDRLADNGIMVKGCKNGEIIGDANTIRVFSVEHIKGLEFEAVFFHDIDQLYVESDTAEVLKRLYVGLSRATFYLGVTSTSPIEEMDFLDGIFSSEDRDWTL